MKENDALIQQEEELKGQLEDALKELEKFKLEEKNRREEHRITDQSIQRGYEIELEGLKANVATLTKYNNKLKELLNKASQNEPALMQSWTKELVLSNKISDLEREISNHKFQYTSLQRKYNTLSFFTNPLDNAKSYIFWVFIVLLVIFFVLTLQFILRFFSWITPKKWKKENDIKL